jgi:hypothetical protein
MAELRNVMSHANYEAQTSAAHQDGHNHGGCGHGKRHLHTAEADIVASAKGSLSILLMPAGRRRVVVQCLVSVGPFILPSRSKLVVHGRKKCEEQYSVIRY